MNLKLPDHKKFLRRLLLEILLKYGLSGWVAAKNTFPKETKHKVMAPIWQKI